MSYRYWLNIYHISREYCVTNLWLSGEIILYKTKDVVSSLFDCRYIFFLSTEVRILSLDHILSEFILYRHYPWFMLLFSSSEKPLHYEIDTSSPCFRISEAPSVINPMLSLDHNYRKELMSYSFLQLVCCRICI